MNRSDSAHALREQVIEAARQGVPLRVRGNGSKAFYGYPIDGELLCTALHSGVTDYKPTELVLSARAGTPLREIEEALAARGQMLPCEPPHFGEATFGGMIAAGLAGPRRPFAGGVSDMVLGCTVLNGRGEILRFGGKVMKNVAGYDISRLMAGSLGCLGVILEATVKVVPRPRAERSFRFNIAPVKTASFTANLAASGYPVSATCHDGRNLIVRFSAGAREIEGIDERLRRHLGFLEFEEEVMLPFWHELREQKAPFFTSVQGDLWRLSLPPAADEAGLEGDTVREWNGALRWLRSDAPPSQVFERAAELGGSATLFRPRQPETEEFLFQPPSAPLLDWHKRLKAALDPAGIFNPGRMYRNL